jgi:uncharacterized protein (DUF2267 family)
MTDTTDGAADSAAAFAKIWGESITKLLQTAMAFGPEAAPPEVVREIRAGVFKALANSWDEFMRSPQFLEAMKHWMENAITFRKLTNDFMANVRNEMQATSRDDVDTIMLAVRHMEKRLLDRIEELAARVDGSPTAAAGGARRPGAPRARKPKPSSKAAGKRGRRARNAPTQ